MSDKIDFEFLKNLKELASKSASQLAITGLVIATVLALYFSKNLLNTILFDVFYSAITILLLIISSKISNKEKALNMGELSSQKELKEKENELISKEITKKLIDKHNPNVARFLKKLDEKGVSLIKDIEKKLLSSKGNAYYLLESGEKTPDSIKKIIKTKSVFENYIRNIENLNIFKVKFPGASSFMIFSSKQIDPGSLIKGYYDHINKLKNDLKNQTESQTKWFENLLNNKKPMIIVAQPYLLSLLDVLNMLEGRVSEKQRKEINKLMLNLSEKQIRIYSIKISFIWESINFSDTIYERLKNKELEIERSIKETYKIRKDNYFFDILSKKNVSTEIKEIIKKLIPEIENEVEFENFLQLIKDIQTNLLGVVNE